MKSLRKFKRWYKKESKNRGLICHFYISESKKQFYDNADFAYFNLFSKSKNWIVKGTVGHGIKSKRGKTSHTPCLNCFKVDKKFYNGIKKLHDVGNDKFELGIIFNKRGLRGKFKKIILVSTERPKKMPPPNKCHYYDNPRARMGVLFPFNFCDVIRIEIPKTKLNKCPIAVIPNRYILGILCKKKDGAIVRKLCKLKKMKNAKVLSVL